jgi:uncharacterized oxidoreductase
VVVGARKDFHSDQLTLSGAGLQNVSFDNNVFTVYFPGSQTKKMNISGHTILITGGGSGIGRGLAEAFHALGNKVIITGRRKDVLDQTAMGYPGMISVVLDVEKPKAIQAFALQVISDHPTFNVLINNAGIMQPEDLTVLQKGLTDSEATITTNLLAPIRLTAAFLPHLQKQSYAAIINVTSGLGLLPLAMAPTYCASKAALHSYTQSLRYQLRNTAVQVLEVIPLSARTELGGARQVNDPNAMPSGEFIAETMDILKSSPQGTEICVERVKQLRFAESIGHYQKTFTQFSDAITGAASTHVLKETGLI